MAVSIYLVTVKLPRRADHDPHRKITGLCPVEGGGMCTDVTGQHHTILEASPEPLDKVRERWEGGGFHVTRIEASGTQTGNLPAEPWVTGRSTA